LPSSVIELTDRTTQQEPLMSTTLANTSPTTPRGWHGRSLDGVAFAVVLAAMFTLLVAFLGSTVNDTGAADARTLASSPERSVQPQAALVGARATAL
jgi:hypothetical protein